MAGDAYTGSANWRAGVIHRALGCTCGERVWLRSSKVPQTGPLWEFVTGCECEAAGSLPFAFSDGSGHLYVLFHVTDLDPWASVA
jgi:hypothetical protein